MNKYIIEFLGTFFLILIIGLSNSPLAVGLGLAILVYMGAHVSGAHYNPVVSLAMFINDEIDKKEIGLYIASQLSGAILATYSIKELGKELTVKANQNVDLSNFLIAEILFTFLLVFVILNVALSKNLKGNQFYGIAIGLTVAVGGFSVGDISGAVFNPAVSFGPSIIDYMNPLVDNSGEIIKQQNFHYFPYYLIASIIGSVIASYLYKKVYS
tara:strand:+ start:221 stop:859 length:639 start_codon:yes stop_codon:yes gene_type:complete